MQNYNPYNPVYKFKSDKAHGQIPNETHVEENEEEDLSKSILPTSYGLYVPPPDFEKGEYESVTWLQYISSTIDSKDRDYAKYPNPFNFQTSKLPEFYKNVKIFQMFYISLPQFNLMQVAIPGDPNCTFMQTYLLTNTVALNQNIINGANTYTICNNVNGETDFIINFNISVVYTIDSSGNFWNYGFSSTYKLNSNPYLRLQINELPYSPILTTDQTTYSFIVRMSRARNYIAYASVRAPTKVYKEHNLINLPQLTFKFYDSTGQPLSISYLDNYASPINDPSNYASKYNYIRHPLFYWHQIIMGVRIGVIRTSFK